MESTTVQIYAKRDALANELRSCIDLRRQKLKEQEEAYESANMERYCNLRKRICELDKKIDRTKTELSNVVGKTVARNSLCMTSEKQKSESKEIAANPSRTRILC